MAALPSFEDALRHMASQQVELQALLAAAHERELQKLGASGAQAPVDHSASSLGDDRHLERDGPVLPPSPLPGGIASPPPEAEDEESHEPGTMPFKTLSWRTSSGQMQVVSPCAKRESNPQPPISERQASGSQRGSAEANVPSLDQPVMDSVPSLHSVTSIAADEHDDEEVLKFDSEVTDGDDDFNDDASEPCTASQALQIVNPRSQSFHRRVSRRHDLADMAGRFAGGPVPNSPSGPAGLVRTSSFESHATSVSELQDIQQLAAQPKARARISVIGTGISDLVNSFTPNGARKEKQQSNQPWPIWFEVLDAMGDDIVDTHKPSNLAVPSERASEMKALRRSQIHIVEQQPFILTRLLKQMVLHPSSEKRLFWVLSNFVFIMYDVVMIPLSAFDLHIDQFEYIVAWIIATYWTLNCIVSMFMGYHEKFSVELRFHKTLLRYAKTWLAPDMALVIVDWYIIGRAVGAARSEASSARVAKSLYIARAFRLLRLVRVAKLPSSLREATTYFMRSEYTSLSAGILKQLAFILLINHLTACTWYMIGTGNDNGWVKHFIEEDSNWQLRYFTSLHWSLTQFTPAAMEVYPHSLEERVFAISVLVFAMVCFSSFVSNITNLMNHLRSLKSVETKQLAKLERYMQDNGISFALCLRVKRYLDHWMSEAKKRPQEKDVEMISKLSDPLRMEIHYESHRPILIRHPFFAHYEETNVQAMRKLCHTALKSIHLSAGDDLFHTGETAKAMYFVKSGELAYRRPFGHMTDKLEEGDWICEMVLFRPWEHCGTVTSQTESSLMAIDFVIFHTIARETQTANKICEEDCIAYAFKAAEILAEVPQRELTDLDDSEIYEAAHIARETFTKNLNMDESEEVNASPAHSGWMGHLIDNLIGSSTHGGKEGDRKSGVERNSGGGAPGSLNNHRTSITRNSQRADEIEQVLKTSSATRSSGKTQKPEAMRSSSLRRAHTQGGRKGSTGRLSGVRSLGRGLTTSLKISRVSSTEEPEGGRKSGSGSRPWFGGQSSDKSMGSASSNLSTNTSSSSLG